MAYTVNGIAVGHDPEEIERKDSYEFFSSKVGNSKDSIKIIENFASDKEIEYLLKEAKRKEPLVFVSQKDEDGEPTSWMRQYMSIIDSFNLISRVKDQVSKSYQYTNIKEKEDRLSVVEWSAGSGLSLHVDDLGYVTDNHVAALIYLNDDYEGGQINFPTHELFLKPKKGDLIFFPGNMHYAHEVSEVISGTRYTVPVWFTIP